MAAWQDIVTGIKVDGVLMDRHVIFFGALRIAISRSIGETSRNVWILSCYPWFQDKPLTAATSDIAAAKKEALDEVRKKLTETVTAIKWSGLI